MHFLYQDCAMHTYKHIISCINNSCYQHHAYTYIYNSSKSDHFFCIHHSNSSFYMWKRKAYRIKSCNTCCLSAGSGEGPMTGFCEHGDELLGSIKKAGYFLIRWVTISFSYDILHHGWGGGIYIVCFHANLTDEQWRAFTRGISNWMHSSMNKGTLDSTLGICSLTFLKLLWTYFLNQNTLSGTNHLKKCVLHHINILLAEDNFQLHSNFHE